MKEHFSLAVSSINLCFSKQRSLIQVCYVVNKSVFVQTLSIYDISSQSVGKQFGHNATRSGITTDHNYYE